ncbi:MAG: hypothetical protein HC822_11350 [Oscillochloris sp.]|nr:hypothetical protein [Oscillochloris sp.]
MEILVTVLKYGFIAVLAVEAILVGRALVGMVRERAQDAASPDVSAVEE